MTGGDVAGALLGVLAAAAFTASFALQQRANLDAMAAGEAGARPVVRRPEWIGGLALQPVGFALQAVALGIGAFAAVQPALVTQLAFMVPAGAWVVHRRLHAQDWFAPVLVLVGLATFEVATQPTVGRRYAPGDEWILPLVVLLALFATLLAAARLAPSYRAALAGGAAGVWGGVVGALAKQLIGMVGDGASLFGAWATWALAFAGVLSLLWANLALRGGRLASAVATMSVGTALASLLLAVTVFDEDLAPTTAGRIAAVAGGAVMAAGVALVARSPSLLALDQRTGASGVAP